jgi:hypothetical protein
MKQSVQQLKRTQPKVVSKKPPQLAYVRPAVVHQSNHRQQDNNKWELQADEAATRVMRGEEGVGRRLTPVAAASKAIASSRGVSLPDTIRSELEQGFGADLSSVRIHTDRPANTEVILANSKAFAAGADIFFGTNEYRPDTPEGFGLLAHEVAHVIQQTGRPTHDGRLRVTQVKGGGDIQYASLDSKKYVTVNDMTFDKIALAHNVNSDAALQAYAEKIKQTLIPKGQTAPDLIHKESRIGLYKYIKRHGFPRNTNFYPFLYDCLKLTSNGWTAYNLAYYYPKINTRYPMPAMYQFAYEVLAGNWVAFQKVYKRKSELRLLWALLIDTFRQMVFAPYRGPQTVNYTGIGTLGDLIEKWKRPYAFIDYETQNELYFGAATLMEKIDDERMQLSKNIFKKVRRFDAATVSRTWLTAYEVRRWAENLSKSKNKGFAEIGSSVYKVANNAVAYWKQVFDLSSRNAFTYKNPEDVKGVKLQLQRHKHFTQDLPAKLYTVVKTVFKLGRNHSLPSSSTYAWRISYSQKLLLNFSKNVLQMELLKLMKSDNPKMSLALNYGIFMQIIEFILSQLGKYDAKKDRKNESKYKVSDIRFAHRQRTARYLYGIVVILEQNGLFKTKGKDAQKGDWYKIKSYLKEIIEYKKQGKSKVALLSNWKMDRSAKIGDMASDMKSIHELKPLSMPHIVKLYQALYYSDLDKNIKEILKQERQTNLQDPFGSLKDDPILKRALDKSERPRRWIVEDVEIGMTPEDREWRRSNPKDYHPVAKKIKNHPKTVSFDSLHTSLTTIPTDVLYNMDYAGEVYLWTIPAVYRLVELLKTNGTINKLVAKGHGKPIDDIKKMPWNIYISALASYMKTATKAEINKALKSFTKESGRMQKGKDKDLKGSLRSLSTHERRLLSLRIKSVMKKYDRDSKDARVHRIPGLVSHALGNYGYYVHPPEDRFLQMAALMLSIAPALNKGLGDKEESFLLFFTVNRGVVKNYDVLNEYIGHLISAQKHATGQNRKKMEKLLNANEKKEVDVQLIMLNVLLKGMKDARRKQQKRFGFSTSKRNQTLKSKNFASPVKTSEEPFAIDGVTYRILKVYKDFEFTPSYGTGDSKAESLLKVGGGKNIPRTQRKSDRLMRVRIRNGTPFDITAKDDAWLHKFNYVISMRAFVLGLQNTAKIIEAYVEGLMDLAEFIPGAGQAVMAARITGSILQFITSDEFDAISGLLSGDVTLLIKDISGQLDKALTPEGMIELLLFGSPYLSKIADLGGTSKKSNRISSKTKKSPLGTIFKAAMGLGKVTANALGKLEQSVQTPVRGLQTFVVTRPNLTRAVLFVADNAHRLDTASGINPATMKKQLGDSADQFKQQINNVFIVIQKMELPSEVVPIRLVSKHLVSMLLDRMGSKVKYAKRLVVWPILEATGSLDYIFGEIERGIKGTSLDPNKYWKEFVDKNIDAKMKASVNDVVKDIVIKMNKVSQGAFGAPIIINQSNSAKLSEFNEDEFKAPEFKLYTEVSPELDDEQDFLSIFSTSGAIPLPDDVRHGAEKRFGHDFSHVRVILGGAATRFTDLYNAKGIASGSYIFLNDSSAVTGDAGSHVLDHELVHVIQQTGNRPMGGEYSSQPQPGHPGKGLSVNPQHEAEAESVAKRVRDKDEPSPVNICGKGFGLQPLSTEGLRRVLRKFASFEEMEEVAGIVLAEKIKKVPRSSRKYTYANAIWLGVKEVIKTLNSAQFVRHLRKPSAKVKQHFSNNVAKIIDTDTLRKLAASALVETKAKGTKKGVPKTYSFRPNRFVRALEALLLVKGGVGISINLTDSYKRQMAKGKAISPSKNEKLIEELKVTGIYLPAIGGSSGLWSDAMSTFGSDASKYQVKVRTTLRPRGMANKIKGTDANNKEVMITVFSTRSTTLQFTKKFVEYIKRLSAGAMADPKTLPTATQYANPKLKDKLGLRVGTYEEHIGSGLDRQSHHTTQLLLVEYFRNDTTPHPFDKGKKYPGLKWPSGGKPQFLKSSSGQINFEKLAKGTRGDKMPAILIATRTHQKGGLHIKPSGKEQDDGVRSGRSSQANSMDNKFRKYFKSEMATTGLSTNYYSNATKKKAEFNAYVNALAPEDRAKIADANYRAMQKTYSWMRSVMIPPLETALINHEVPYYREVAMKDSSKLKKTAANAPPELKKAYDMKASHIASAYTEAVANNKAVMEGEGWKD